MTKLALALSFAVTSLLSATALAHPGHGNPEAGSLLHHLMEPEHALVAGGAVVLGAAIVLARRGLRRSRAARTR